MTTAVVGGAPIGGHPSERIPQSIEEAAAKRRFWDRFHGQPQQCAPGLTLFEIEAFEVAARPEAGMRAVEVGCGRGMFASALAVWGCETTGYDWSEVAVEASRWAWRDPRLTFEVHDFLGGQAPAGVEDGSVDILALRSTVQYLDLEFWRAAKRWLRPLWGVMYVVVAVNERQPPEKSNCGLPDAVIEDLRQEFAGSQRWDLTVDGAYTALLLWGPLEGGAEA